MPTHFSDKTIIVITIITAAVCIVTAISVMLIEHLRTRRIMKSMERMLEEAIGGAFTPDRIDESLLSSLEFKLAHYLSAAKTSESSINAEKDRIKALISDISHQTKTPIASCLLYCELLKEQDLTEAGADYVAMLNTQLQKLHFLIASLIKLSRLETGILILHPVCDDVAELVRKAAGEFSPQALSKGLTFSILPIETDKPVMALFDEKWTLEALGNILDNAVKYTDTGGITIRIKPYEMFCCIEIADTGIGIAEEEQAQVFSRFYRSIDASDKEGVGIGLYLAREIITGEGGYIKLTSTPGNGSVFALYLPNAVS